MAEAVPGTKGRRIREGLTGSRIGSNNAVERQAVDPRFSLGRKRTSATLLLVALSISEPCALPPKLLEDLKTIAPWR